MTRTLAFPLAPLATLVEHAREYAAEGRAPSTRKAYAADFRAFEAWCGAQSESAMPARPELVALYATWLADAGRRVATIERAITSIAQVHRARGIDWPRAHPAISEVMAGVRRRLGAAPAQKSPIVDQMLVSLVDGLGDDLASVRDRALLTLGWFGAFRRAELVSLDVEDIERTDEGLVVRLRRSKGDQEGRGAAKGIPRAATVAVCAVRAIAAWIDAAGIVAGPIFRGVDQRGRVSRTRLSPSSVALIVKRHAERCGFDPARFAAHSLRAGFATAAAKHGKSLDSIMRQTLHRSERVARSYIRHATLFDDNPATGIL